jgi:tRNA G46 methylase TrmB
MFGNSQPIESQQQGIHPELVHWVNRARAGQRFRKPVATFNATAFAQVEHWLAESKAPWILDSGCGTGLSTLALAEQFPHARVVGVDRSAHRLSKTTAQHERILWVRADLVDFWRLLAASHWRPQQHFLLYPNPYPKPQHLKQRWHAHPVFPWLVECCHTLTCRTNWLIYAQELQQALLLYGIHASVKRITPASPISAFERKYQASAHALWEVSTDPQLNSVTMD